MYLGVCGGELNSSCQDWYLAPLPIEPSHSTLPILALFCRFEYLFNFDNTFEIHDDIEVLKRMGMSLGLESGKCSLEDLQIAKSLVPKALEGYVTGMLEMLYTRSNVKLTC